MRRKEKKMDKTLKNVLIIAISVILLTIVGAGGFLIGKLSIPTTGGYGFSPMMGFNRGMRNWQFQPSSTDILSIDEAEKAVERFIGQIDTNDNLDIEEIMIFDNHAYAQIFEAQTGIGAFEVLVDPNTLDVYLEQGASMMWNQKYGNMRGGMMGWYDDNSDLGQPMPISADEAVTIASEYLSRSNTNLTADDHAEPFYGYYTLHTLENGEVSGMLSVNGYNGQIIIHNWHGKLIEMSEHS